MLVETTVDALVVTGVERLVVSGGVAANRRLRARMTEAGAALGITVLFPSLRFCTDNAAMIALARAPRLPARADDRPAPGAPPGPPPRPPLGGRARSAGRAEAAAPP